MSLQIVSVIGNATKDAERRISKDGVVYVTFRIAVSGSGEKPTFYNVLLFGRYGEVMQEHVTRGREVFVNGRLEVNEKGFISVIADHVELLRRPKSKVEPKEENKETAKKAKK